MSEGRVGNQQHGVDTRKQLAVGARHADFVVEVGAAAHSSQDHVALQTLGGVDHQSVDAGHPDSVQPFRDRLEQLDSDVDRQRRVLRVVVGHTDHELVEEPCTSPDEVEVAEGRRVEGAGEEGASRAGG
jgi:hypothetical protein